MPMKENVLMQKAFQYGQVIKLPLQILPSIHGKPYGIDQSATVVAD
jgi:hypothetical protein